jgi:hypothetical protein
MVLVLVPLRLIKCQYVVPVLSSTSTWARRVLIHQTTVLATLQSWRVGCLLTKNISNTCLGLHLHDCTVQQHYVPPVIMAMCDAQNCTRLHLGECTKLLYLMGTRYLPDTRWVRARVQNFTRGYSHGRIWIIPRVWSRAGIYSTRSEPGPLSSLLFL